MLNTWGALLNTASSQIPIILLGTLYSSTSVGFYALGYRTLIVPVSLVGNSISTVFLERAAKERTDPERLKQLVLKTYRTLLTLSAILFPVMTFYGDLIIPWLFGANWLEAGRYVQWMSIWLVFVLASSPLSHIFTILERQGLSLIMNIVIFASRVIAMVGSMIIGLDAYQMIIVFSLTGVLAYLVMCITVLRVVKSSLKEILKASWTFLPIMIAHGLIALVLRMILA